MTDKPNVPAAGSQPDITADYIAANHADVADHFRAEGQKAAAATHAEALETARTEAAVNERARILAIQTNALPGHDDLVATMIADGTEPGAAAQQILAAEKETGARLLQQRSENLKVTEGVDPSASEQGQDDDLVPGLDSEAGDAALNTRWHKDAKVRAAYNNDLAAYLAVESGIASGAVTVQ